MGERDIHDLFIRKMRFFAVKPMPSLSLLPISVKLPYASMPLEGSMEVPLILGAACCKRTISVDFFVKYDNADFFTGNA